MATFRMNGERVLEVQLAGDTVRAQTGAMVAYEGEVTFKNAGMGGGDGLKAALKRRVAGESLSLMEMTGHGLVYLAREAAQIALVELAGDTLSVESSSLLAIGAGLKADVAFAGLHGALAGQGLATTTVSGHGTVAITSEGPPIVLQVAPGEPLVVDPDAFVASAGQLTRSFVTDVSWKSVLGEGGGEPFSIRFEGSGLVYIQPAER